ncbi:MAG: alpha/beta hydrolase [Chitinophagaceae bacterium]|nr:alpha/beta hydrolase [Chitinophagaceae bacterium]MCA6515176.1 alpha/beta hydrolase [Chitinophagaceae bacterium]
MRLISRWLLVAAGILVLYWVGPNPADPVYTNDLPVLSDSPQQLEMYVAEQEKKHQIKPDNQARIVWNNDSLKNTTEYALVYLHGFSASQEEGNPVHRNLAKAFGCNLYLARLAEHGIDTSDALMNYTAEGLWQTAKEAYAIGKKLGKKVILMGTSTGGTVALQLAAAFPEIAGIILYSPNISINDPNAWLLNNPWGLQIARLVKGSNFNTAGQDDSTYKKYWNHTYRLEATVQLQELLETTMVPATFGAVRQPVLALYYFKDENNQDKVVKVSAIQKMMQELGTPDSLKRSVAMANAGNHVLASPIVSKDVAGVEKETSTFLQQVMKLSLTSGQ